MMELSGLLGPLVPGRRSVGSVAHPAEHLGGVRRAVVKIYHGRNIDHAGDM
ncbi:hypothetical protein ACGFNV_40965 [Streptomyces sp. NPDC048751]|uniref:hypothetical protein n=1 Tax=Streptomyces sp. NPDC048751 TaxID=3365591 RepID=UPI00371D7110